MFQVKGIVYGIIFAVVVGVIGYSLRTWHYAPLANQERQINSLQEQLDETGRQLNLCEANLSKMELQGYINGVGENDEEPVIDFSDITY